MKPALTAFFLGLALEVVGLVASVHTFLGVLLMLGSPLVFWVLLPGMWYLRERKAALLGPVTSGVGFYTVLLSMVLPRGFVYPVAGLGWALVLGGPLVFWAAAPLIKAIRDRKRSDDATLP